ncbi:MAG: hypothetical protein HUJ61_04190, partial [Bacilli bacterium]|nr:hypothetical protein [Bacilli bacterium]
MLKTLLAISLFPILLSAFGGVHKGYDFSDTTLSGEGDNFKLHDITFEKGETFVYSSTLSFNEGQAAGVVFGATLDEEYYVFNMDRYDNRVKLLHFVNNEETWKVDIIKEEYFIG